jgi:RNA polymerase sigma factor (sigma-70 family)
MLEQGIVVLKQDDTMDSLSNRLINFVKKRVNSLEDAEDIVQDVFSVFAEGNLAETVEDISAWLYRAARNKIVDLYRKRSRVADTSELSGNEASYASNSEYSARFWEELETALSELPDEQRFVFEQNELEGKSFREIAEETGDKVNTLLSRKRYAVLYLRERLKELYDEMIN